METLLDLLRICDTPGGVTLTGIMATQSLHIASATLVFGNTANPVFCIFALQESEQQVVHTPRIGNVVLPHKGGARCHPFSQRCILAIAFWNVQLPDDIGKRNASDTRNDRKIVRECLLPFGSLTLVFKPPGVYCLGIGHHQIDVRLADLR